MDSSTATVVESSLVELQDKQEKGAAAAAVENDKDNGDGAIPIEERPAKRSKKNTSLPLLKVCDSCGLDKPRYRNKITNTQQLDEIYGGRYSWNCSDCSEVVRRNEKEEEDQRLKQRQHAQKLADQNAKTAGTFMEARPCMQCVSPTNKHKTRDEYTGKQWKKLYRQCKQCVETNGFQQVLLDDHNGDKKRKNGSRFCSGCKDTKLVADFTADQWRHSVDAERLCKPCDEQEGKAKREHKRLADQQPDANLKRCYACHTFQRVDDNFSNKQQKKVYGMCTPCVTIIHAERKNDNARARETSTRACSECGVQKTISHFGGGQWSKRSDPRCRPCATDLVQRQEVHRQEEKEQRTKEEENQKRKRRCYDCGQFGESPVYSARQWTKTYPSCLDCLGERKKSKPDTNNNSTNNIEKENAEDAPAHQ